MYKKIQNYGFGKQSLEGQLGAMIKEVKSSKELDESDTELIRAITEVLLYDRANVSTDSFSSETVEIIRSYFSHFQKIDEITMRSEIDALEDNLKQIDSVYGYFVLRSTGDDLEEDAEDSEKEYLAIIAALTLFLERYYNSDLLPIIEEAEKDIKQFLDTTYKSAISEAEKTAQINTFLEQKEEELKNLFRDKLEPMNNEAVAQAKKAVQAVDSSIDPESEENIQLINQLIGIFTVGYISNINGNLSTFIRQTNEMAFDNIALSIRTALEDQTKQIKMNRNNLKLSLLTHPKALFRAVSNKLAMRSGYKNFKSLVPLYMIPGLNPSGMTKEQIYRIKTEKQWAETGGLGNLHVVDGMSLHHNDSIFYMPVKNTEGVKTLAKKQRKIINKL